MNDPMDDADMVDMSLGRIVIREGSDHQYIYLKEKRGERGFPIVIGSNEAWEIHRVVTKCSTERPLTHQLTHNIMEALGTKLKRVDIVDLKNNTFYAQLVLQNSEGELTAVVDARPSDAIAIALRARCELRVAEDVLENVRTDVSGPDPLPDFPPPMPGEESGEEPGADTGPPPEEPPTEQ